MMVPLDTKTNRWNFGSLTVQGVCNQVGFELCSEKLVLPFIYTAVGGPAYFAGTILSTVNITKFLSQVPGATFLTRVRYSKRVMACSTLICVAALAAVAMMRDDFAAQTVVVIFLLAAALIGVGKGLGVLAFQDVFGRSLWQSSRARLLFLTGAVTGLGVIASTYLSVNYLDFDGDDSFNSELIVVGAVLLTLSAAAALMLREPAKTTSGGTEQTDTGAFRNFSDEVRGGLAIAGRQTWFRKYLVARMLLTPIEVATPFFAIHAVALHPDTAPSLPTFVVAGALGMMIGGAVFPAFSRKSDRLTMNVSALIACLGALLSLSLQFFPDLRNLATHSAAFLLLAIANQGVSVSKTVYLVNAASDDTRPYCVAASNLVSGVLGFLLALVLGMIAHVQGAEAALIGMIPLNLAAAYYVMRLPSSRNLSAQDGL
ncbi:hypothetical protein Q5Y75_05910 [Ruegeria sp. 2205SS24-7]|uniref:MFS transporter n=1 Tax=Ruegeria discodermiae TaxID=3064389 RepID=UPI0027411112|nr:MFS transporter [Ruegeria sp. 2205SS24-7]MDP5216746.1 hypothetical protein [Ruegeria sp. 2205SS24-7]